jgi:hypothetical protein
MKKALHSKPVKGAVKGEIAHFGVAKIKEAGDNLHSLATNGDGIDGGIMLHLLAWFIRDSVTSALLGPAKFKLPNHSGQGRVTKVYTLLLGELFINSLNPAATLPIELVKKLRINPDLISSYSFNYLSFLLYDGAYSFAIYPQLSANLPYPHPFSMQ